MSDNNRIIDLNKQAPGGGEVPLKLDMTHEPGFVKIMFDPAVVRMRLTPVAARDLAIGLLINAEKAERPPGLIQTPTGQ